MEDLIYVEGGAPLHGEVEISGAKNVALKVIAAALLTDEEVVIQRMPKISDVNAMLQTISYLGAEVVWEDDHTVKINAQTITKTEIPVELVAQLRASVVFWGPLLARFGEATIPFPGGDKIGKRPIDRFIDSMACLGATVTCQGSICIGEAKTLHGGLVRFEKSTVTGTENIIMLATLAEGQTRIEGAANEPEIDDLINMLNQMGASITRVEDHVIEVNGVEALHGVQYTIMGDRIEAATFAIAAAVTGGEVTLKQIDAKHMTAFLAKAQSAGVNYKVVGDQIRFGKLQDKTYFDPVNVETSVYPGFMTDWHPPFAVLLTQADGVSVIHETIHSKRFGYVKELKKMGAEIEPFTIEDFDPANYGFDVSTEVPLQHHAIRIFGPTKLRSVGVTMEDLRAGATVVLAGLIAEGESTIAGVHHLDRGYESFVERLAALGAKIRRETNN